MKKLFTIISLMFIVGVQAFAAPTCSSSGEVHRDGGSEYAALGTNADLLNLIVSSGTLVPTFNKNITNYTLYVSYIVSVISLIGIPEDPEATVASVNNAPLNVGSNPFVVTVTASDGVTTKDYYINVLRSADGAGANLASLTVNPGTLVPVFNPNTINYTVHLDISVTAITITGVPQDPAATVTGNVVNAPLNVGSNVFPIIVTASDGVTIKVYTVIVIRGGGLGTADLMNLIVSTGTLTPVFNPSITSYTLNVAYMSTTITLIGVPQDPAATVTGNVNAAPINVGSNPFVITVTATDGVTTKSYYVDVVRTPVDTNADLASLTVNPGTLEPAFSPDITVYSVNVAHTVAAITIQGTAQSPYATVTGNVTNAPLNFGINNFTVTVTAEDEITTKDYHVTVVRAATPEYAIVASVDGNIGGTISPKGAVTVLEGDNVTFTMTPEYSYYIYSTLVDGVNVGSEKTYTFNNVTAHHTIVVKFEGYTGIEDDVETQGIASVRVYPNPTEGELKIENGELKIENVDIFDVTGRKKLSIFNFQFSILNISHLPAGVYFIRITTENGIVTKKVIKR